MRASLAAAAVALVPAIAAAAAEPAADDLDLGGYGLDASGAAGDDALKIYGFADASYRLPLWSDQNLYSTLLPKENSFAMGSFNLYLAKALSPRIRALGEVRLLYAPNGNIDYTNGTIQTTAATDYSNWNRTVTWGGISIERLYVEADVTDWLTVRFGQFLSPYGIWNVDHGSPVILGVTAPYIIGEGLIPQSQTGIDLFGKRFVGDYAIAYHVTLSNGRGKLQATRDLDENKALGARLELETHWLGSLKLGVSGYLGSYTDRTEDVYVATATSASVHSTILDQHDERSLGADVAWDRGGWHGQAEVIVNEKHYGEGTRPANYYTGFMPDSLAWGWYALVGHRFAWLGVMPFAELDWYRWHDSNYTTYMEGFFTVSLGLNIRPVPALVIKVDVGRSRPIGGSITDSMHILITQAAWAF